MAKSGKRLAAWQGRSHISLTGYAAALRPGRADALIPKDRFRDHGVDALGAAEDLRQMQVHGGPRALQRAHFGLMLIASSWELHAPSQDSRPNARIPASSKDMLLVRPSSKLCGTAFCNPRRADSTQLCALSRCTSSPSPLRSDVRFKFAPSPALIVVSQDGLFFFHRSRR
jgi:hypothetical protein